jgi:hypothetical protein
MSSFRRGSGGGVRVKSESECEQRARECMRKAEAAANAGDRVGWAQLAEDWTTLSKLPFRAAPDTSTRERPLNRIDRIGWLKRLLRG